MTPTTRQRRQPRSRQPSPQPIPAVASLAVDDERLARMWAMTAEQRRHAAQAGHLTLAEMLRWAARAPGEVPLVDGEFFFITNLAE